MGYRLNFWVFPCSSNIVLTLVDGEKVPPFYLIVWGGSEKCFQYVFTTVCLQHGSRRISTFKVPHELTGSLGTALKDQQTSPFHLKNKLSSLHFRTFVINFFCLDFISTEILKVRVSFSIM